MAKPAKKKDKAAKTDESDAKPKGGTGKPLLLAAMVLAAASLGGGFYLARVAFQEDASQFEPEYVDEAAAYEPEESDSYSGGVTDPLATEGHPASDAMALNKSDDGKDDGHSEGEAAVGHEGMMEFDEIVANIISVNAQGVQSKAFLKMNLVMVYRTDEGATATLSARKAFMRDLFIGYARSLTEADVRGMAGIISVKAELLKRARAAAGNDLPQEILISDLIVQ